MSDSEYLLELETEQGFMTREHLAFVQAHDWGQDAVFVNGSIIIAADPGEEWTHAFYEFSHLLTWAGY